MAVGGDLEHCTTKPGVGYTETIEGYPHLQEYRIVLIDTPGFDHTDESDEAILTKISTWLKKLYVMLAVDKAR